MQMADDLLIAMGQVFKKGSFSASRQEYNSRDSVPHTALHHWSQILAYIKTTQARQGGNHKALTGHTLRGPGV
jgi:hypothetical protein